MRRLLIAICMALAIAPIAVQAQKNIATVAGGGPNNLSALKSSIGVPVGLGLDSKGNLYVVDTHSNRVYIVSSGIVTVFAGTGGQGLSGDTGLATAAQLSLPTGLFVDANNNVFIADSGNNVIRKVAATTNIITTVAGNGTPGFTGDNGSPTSAQLNNPTGVFVDAANDIFIADSGNNAIREVVAGTSPVIQTIAGSAVGTAGFSGDGGPATSATLRNPQDVALDGNNNIFIADHDNNAIREVLASDKTIHTYAGSPTGVPGVTGEGGLATAALLHSPSEVFADANNNLFIADTGNSIIREVTVVDKKIHAVAGNGTSGFGGDGGTATLAQLSFPRGLFVDSSENIYISDTGNSFVRLVTALDGRIHQDVGNGTLSFSGDSFAATSASLSSPNGVAVNGVGDIFIADTNNNVIRRVLNSTGIIQTVAGIGTAGIGGNNGLATSALLNGPSGVFVDGLGNFFIADTNNNEVREVLAATGNIKTVAGNGTAGFSGDTGFAVNAQLSGPTGVVVDGSGNIFIADRGNNVIREVTAADNLIHTVAGNHTAGFSGDNGPATSAQLSAPADVAVDAFGDIFIADTGNNVVREVLATAPNAGNIVAFAGNHTGSPGFSGDNGPPTAALMNGPAGVVLDPSGDVFIADTKNQVVREVLFGGNIQTVAGNHTAGFSGDGAAATSAMLQSPSGLAVDTLGGLEIADTGNSRIRDVAGLVQVPAVTLSAATLTFNSQVIGSVSAAMSVTVTNSGAAPMSVGNVGITDSVTGAITTNFTQTNNCAVRLVPGANCTVNVKFAPPSGGPFTANLNISDSAPGSPQVVTLTGTGVSAVVLAPIGLSFPLQINGTSGTPQSITLTNNQAVPVNFIGSPAVTITNQSPTGSFSQQNTCGVTVAAGGTCTITVTFTPQATGANSATLVITDDAPGGSQSATLFGLGTGATAMLSPTSLTFPTQIDTTTSAVQTVTLTNGGKETLNITSIIFTGPNNGDFIRQATTCASTVLPGANCTISVTFTPTAGGARSASLTINDSAGDSPQNVTLSGTGLDFQIVVPAGGNSTATVPAGTTANYNLQLSAVGGAATTDSIEVTMSCSGAPTGATCTFPSAPISVTPATSANFNVTVSTTAAPKSFLPPGSFGPRGIEFFVAGLALALLATLTWMLRVRSAPESFRRRVYTCVASMAFVALLGISGGVMAGCNSNVAAGTTGGGPGTTPAGTYNITVTGKSSSDAHSFVVTMTVQ
ncbi:MAG TPA: choice-of-anchor D domain-containing protein [Candidatus Acidoferrales bacterium]|nr:choice-of-anchor D domain-containing protein [Candidatus Acidoferrales bacterium]